MTAKFCPAQDPEADGVLESNLFALLGGMLLDQQVSMEQRGGQRVALRLGE